MDEVSSIINMDTQTAGAPTGLHQICATYGFDIAALAGPVQPDTTTPQYIVHGQVTDGRVQALRVMSWGRFGNYVFQVLHAVMLARQIGCRRIELTPVPGGPVKRRRRIKGITFTNPLLLASSLPMLSGHFFKAPAFPAHLQKISPGFVNEVVQDYLKPIFQGIRRHKTRPGAQVAVAHFRAGDIFSEAAPHFFYVQPPVSFYIAAITHLMAERGVTAVRLVAEDRGNPAVAGVEDELRRRGIPFESQSKSFERDFGILLGASHLIASFSTFVEAAALLSDDLKTYTAFRDLDSHVTMHRREKPMLEVFFKEAGVDCVVVEDVTDGYIPRRGWANTSEQIDLMLNYGTENLRLTTLAAKPRARRRFWF